LGVHDLTNAASDLFRSRQMKSAYLAAEVWELADEEASRLARAEMTAFAKPEQDEIARFLRSQLPPEERAVSFPHANQKFEELEAAASSA
jgi:hypothetical protein